MPEAAGRPVRTIALMNQKGGVGKTTTTVNLAAAMARLGRRVLVVDLDPQAHATLHLGVQPGPGPTVYDLMLDPADVPLSCARTVGENLLIVPSETDLAGAEGELADAADRRTRLRTVLDSIIGAAEAAGQPLDS